MDCLVINTNYYEILYKPNMISSSRRFYKSKDKKYTFMFCPNKDTEGHTDVVCMVNFMREDFSYYQISLEEFKKYFDIMDLHIKNE